MKISTMVPHYHPPLALHVVGDAALTLTPTNISVNASSLYVGSNLKQLIELSLAVYSEIGGRSAAGILPWFGGRSSCITLAFA